MRRLWLAVAIGGAVGLVAAFILWRVPADDFVFVPGSAKPLAGHVRVDGRRAANGQSVRYVDVFVRRTTWLEELLPFLRPDGSALVPEHALLPPGTTEEERERRNRADMERSERIAALVALRALGYRVVAVPQGALVVAVAPGTPAEGRLEQGDVIVAADGERVRTPDELRRVIARRQPGARVRLTVRRDGKRLELTLGTVRSPDDPQRPIVGVQVDQEARIRVPLDVEIDLGRVGGPSAGLPFALEIARLLGRDVTHGCVVAATGELALDGTVVEVGGVAQKTIGARRTGVDVLLVPAGENAREAREHADGLRVVPVESFQQALRFLTTKLENC
ncbi:MAG TPA: PDZ domain-containing protein [Gaiellaceae bacterium]|nr:PDZ domain-containing protein [Gaiellaceae bacterium]